jgi:hypothetical protein
MPIIKEQLYVLCCRDCFWSMENISVEQLDDVVATHIYDAEMNPDGDYETYPNKYHVIEALEMWTIQHRSS